MKKIMFLFAAVLILAATGCSKEEAATNDVQYVSELKINFAGDTKVSATPNSSGLKYSWEDGDRIEVWEDQNTTVRAKIFLYDEASDSFKPEDDRDDNKLEINKKYFAVTGSEWYNISVENGNSVVPMELKGGTGIKSVLMITDVFTATAMNTMATMHHIVGVVEIPVKAAADNAKLKQLGLNSRTANQALRGPFNVSPLTPYEFSFGTNGYFDSYNQTERGTPIELSTTEVTSIFVPAFPGTYSTIDIKYTLDGGVEKTINTNHQLIVNRGEITKISEYTLD